MSERNTIICSNCGGDVQVTTPATRVASCPYCDTTLIVNEDAIRALGKMALLAETPSCLAVGYQAKCLGREIAVLGRIQYRYQSGLWDEWWVQFEDDESYAWISQDEGEYMLEKPLTNFQAPDFDSLTAGDTFTLGKYNLWVEEKDQAVMVGVQGELPLDATPDGKMRYLELTDNKVKLTIEYFDDGSSAAFNGRNLKRTDLEAVEQSDEDDGSWKSPYDAPAMMSPFAARPSILPNKSPVPGEQAETPVVASVVEPAVVSSRSGMKPQSVNCPGCAGAVELRNTQGTVMVACPYCDAVMDVTVPGAAQLLYQSEKQKLHSPIPIGAIAKFNDAEWTVIGRVRYREDDFSGIWVWDEFQLHSPERGYLFLVLEDGHWMLFENLKHRVTFDPRHCQPKQTFSLLGQSFKVFERFDALITYVEGELSWVARLGDKVGCMDAIRPPQMVSAEWTKNELEWSIGRYLTREEVLHAFDNKIKNLPMPKGVGPAQPFLRTQDQRIRAWAGLGIALLLVFMCLTTFAAGDKLFSTGQISSAEYLSENGYVSQPFDVPEGNHICKLYTEGYGLNNSWVGMSVAILDENENVVLDADSEVDYYHGVEGGESWSEGSQTDYTLLRLKGPKKYQLNVFGEAGAWSSSYGDGPTATGAAVSLEIYRGVTPARYFLLAALLTLIYPVWEFGRGILFEKRRWPSDDDDDDDD